MATLSATGLGPVNSVAVKNGVLAVAFEAPNKTDQGGVAVYDVSVNGSVVTLTARGYSPVTVGALPDMITFTPDGTKLLTANEGEPNSYGQATSVDPKGPSA